MISYTRNTIFGYESLSTPITPFYYVKALYSITHFRVRNTTTLLFFNFQLLLLKLKMGFTRKRIEDEFPEDSERSIVLATSNELVMSDNSPLPTLYPYARIQMPSVWSIQVQTTYSSAGPSRLGTDCGPTAETSAFKGEGTSPSTRGIPETL